MTRLLTARPVRTLLTVIAFVVLAGVIGGGVADRMDESDGFAPPDAESVQAWERLEQATGDEPSPGIAIVVPTPDGVDDAAQVGNVAQRLERLEGITRVQAPDLRQPDAAATGLVASDQSSALVLGTVSADVDATQVGERVLDTFADDDVEVGGGSVIQVQLSEQVGKDLARAELLAMPLLVVLSLLFFGLRGAVLSVAVGATTVLGSFLVLTAVTTVYDVSVFSLNLVIGLGLGLAIDYSLFLITRFREELAAGREVQEAVSTTMRTAGRTVAFSAATVAVALAVLTIFPMSFLRSLGLAGAVVAVVAAVAALVISPALFALWGTKLQRRRARTDGDRWYRIAHGVMRRPRLIAATTGVAMLALAAPALGTVWTPVDSSAIPTEQSSRTVADTLEADYPGGGGSAVVVAVETDSATEVSDFGRQVAALPGGDGLLPPTEVADGVWQLTIPVDGDAASTQARQLVEDVRAIDTPLDTLVTGEAASFIDQQTAIGDGLPLALTLLVLLTMLVLWLMTGSVVLPVKAVVMNVLTVGVSLAAVTFVYQDGRLTGLLGYTPNGGIEPTDFLVAAAVVFALSTDYGVFLLGRIKEARDSGASEQEAVALGLARTGRVVTAAAILLAVAVGAFSTSSISFIQQIGVATAVGVLVDAFVVRSLLVPSLMRLLGRWNWWAPMPLRRLHDRIDPRLEGEPAARQPEPAGV